MSAVEKFLYRHLRVNSADAAIELARMYSRESRGMEAAPRTHRALCIAAVERAHQELRHASHIYRTVGLSFLANRVDFFARRVAAYRDLTNFRDLWEKFDRLNASTTSVEEGGRA
jgi:hypothetical protein